MSNNKIIIGFLLVSFALVGILSFNFSDSDFTLTGFTVLDNQSFNESVEIDSGSIEGVNVSNVTDDYHVGDNGNIENNSERNIEVEGFNVTDDTEEMDEVEVVEERGFSVETFRERIVVESKVRWIKKVEAYDSEGIVIWIPEEAENVSIRVGEEVELDENGFLRRLGNFLLSLTFTGNVVRDEVIGEVSDVNEEGKKIILDEFVDNSDGEIIVEYYTQAPEIYEEEISRGKRIIISAPDSLEYEDVLAYTGLSREAPLKNIKLYHVDSEEEVSFDYYDLNENGLIDYIEWNVPHLSDQEYKLIIEIVDAEHLDFNRSFIENIYEEVKERDGTWKKIPDGHYVRVYFEDNLTSNRDITIYARGEDARVEVYEKNSDVKIADFGLINEDRKYKVYLDALEGEQDAFDLFSIGDVEYDYIVDPEDYNFGEVGSIDVSDSLDWTWVAYSGSYSSTPVILATPVTTANCGVSCSGNGAGQGGMYPIPLVKDVSTSGFNFSMCIDGGSSSCTTGASQETFHYFVFDVDNAANYDWIEAGTTAGVDVGGTDTTETYTSSFSGTPEVWTQAQTYSQGTGIGAHAWVEDNGKSTSGFTYVGCVHTGTGDSCDSSATDETFGYVAIDTSEADFPIAANFQFGFADISNSDWSTASLSGFTNPRVMVTQNDDDGGQDPEYAWARNVDSDSLEFRYCEEDAGNVCNTHTSEKTYWFAIEEGVYSSGLSWTQSSLDLGSGYLGAGNLTGIVNVTSIGVDNNDTIVSCLSGNCSEITDDWTDWTNLTNGESLEVNFSCSDSEAGSYSASFKVNSTQVPAGSLLSVSCSIEIPKGALIVNLSNPVSGQTTDIIQNQTFFINASFVCEGVVGSMCGVVEASARYNGSTPYGTGVDGDRTVDSSGVVVNNYTYLLGNESVGNLSIIVNNASEFNEGDEILVIQMQNGSGDGNAGTHEFVVIDSISDNVINLETGLENFYGSGVFNGTPSSTTQIVRVPHYTNLTINAGASITSPKWDGYTGGIVVVKASDFVDMQGNINVSFKGFRGGDMGYGNNEPGWEGEGVYGLGVESGTVGGSTYPTEWNNGGAGQQGISHCGGGGGGGGYALRGEVGNTDDNTNYNDTAFGGYAVGVANLSGVFFGGGGGGGGDDDDGGNDAYGGDGAGIVYVASNNISNAFIYSNGESKIGASDCGAAEGSGGAGGTIWLTASYIDINEVSALGGDGANVFDDTNGWGGDGSDGRIRFDFLTLTGNNPSPVSGYNGTPSGGMKVISGSSSSPFWTLSSQPQSCGSVSYGESCDVSWVVNATGNVGDLWDIDVNFLSDTSGVNGNDTEDATLNISSPSQEDNVYPEFSNYQDNNGTLVDSGTGIFNVSVISTNGTVLIEIDGGNVSASNIVGDVYEANYVFSPGSSGVYAYRWHSWGDGSDENYNYSSDLFHTVVENQIPEVFLELPVNNSINTSDSSPGFVFNVTDESASLDCSLILQNSSGFERGYGRNESVLESVSTEIVANESLADGDYLWWVNCSDDLDSGISEKRNLSIDLESAIAISLSPNLEGQISWDLLNLPVYNQSASGNNGTEYTTYYINVSSEGAGVDIYLRANGDLLNEGLDVLGLGNETYSYNLTNRSVPSGDKFSLTENYADNKIGDNLDDGDVVYLKFFLTAPSAQPAGTYNNSLLIKAVLHGQSP